ncbi:hypothetical protein KCU98_g235, partial [Aureobasidium melanogenum]
MATDSWQHLPKYFLVTWVACQFVGAVATNDHIVREEHDRLGYKSSRVLNEEVALRFAYSDTIPACGRTRVYKMALACPSRCLSSQENQEK